MSSNMFNSGVLIVIVLIVSPVFCSVVYPVNKTETNDSNDMLTVTTKAPASQITESRRGDRPRIPDSYMTAYYLSKNKFGKRQDEGYSYNPQATNYGPPNYGAYPVTSFASSQYGAPNPFYGSPAPQQSAASTPIDPQTQGFSLDLPIGLVAQLFKKLKKKLNIFTILKIILKLVIFKKIVTFLAILCLLLFIPQFKPMEMEEDSSEESEDDKFYGYSRSRQINKMETFVSNKIDNFIKFLDQME